MSLAMWWVNLWNPIVPAKYNLAEEAKKKLQAGEISLEEYQHAIGVYDSTEAEIASEIAMAEKSTAILPAFKEGLSEATSLALSPVKTALQELGFWIVLGAVLYILVLRESKR